MTQLEVAYHYHTPPTEPTMRALDNLREVYGVRRITFNEPERIVRVEFDASRFKGTCIAGLLQRGLAWIWAKQLVPRLAKVLPIEGTTVVRWRFSARLSGREKERGQRA